MRTALRMLIPIVLAVALALWLMTVPGFVSLRFGAYAVEAPLWLAGLATVLLLLLLALIVRLLVRLRVAGIRRRARRAMRRRDEGDEAIVGALAALAAGDGAGAARLAGRARKKVGETPLTLLVEGHAARAQRNDTRARLAFGRLSEIGPPGAFLGYRGLAALAVETGDKEEAAASGRAALAMRPDANWARALVFDAAARQGDWRTALTLLPAAPKGSEEGHRRAALLLGAAAEEKDQKAALRLVEEAVELAPDLAPAHAARIALLEAQGQRRRANSALERGIVTAAHPMLAALALAPRPGETEEARARRVEALANYANGSGEAELMAAQAAFEAKLWQKARSHAARAKAAGLDDRRVFALLSQVAAAENPATEAGRAEAELHLREAAAAPQEPGWWCASCGTRHEAWSPVCPSCGAVASLRWGSAPPPPERTLALPPPVPGL